jgi:hypothetical protein
MTWPSGLGVRREADGSYSVILSFTARNMTGEQVEQLAIAIGQCNGARTTIEDAVDLSRELDRPTVSSEPKRQLVCYSCGEEVSYVESRRASGLLGVLDTSYKDKVLKALELDDLHGSPNAFDEDKPVVCVSCVQAAIRGAPETTEIRDLCDKTLEVESFYDKACRISDMLSKENAVENNRTPSGRIYDDGRLTVDILRGVVQGQVVSTGPDRLVFTTGSSSVIVEALRVPALIEALKNWYETHDY